LHTDELGPVFLEARAFPELARHFEWIDADFLPPGYLIARAMHEPMMDSTERHHELVAGFAPKRPGLRETQVVRV
jgi:hypothetical protein